MTRRNQSNPRNARQTGVGEDLGEEYVWHYPRVITEQFDSDATTTEAGVAPTSSARFILGDQNDDVLYLYQKIFNDGHEYFIKEDTIQPANIDSDHEIVFITDSTYLIKETDTCRFYNWPHDPTGVTIDGYNFAYEYTSEQLAYTTDGTDIVLDEIVDTSIGSHTNLTTVGALTQDDTELYVLDISPTGDKLVEMNYRENWSTSASVRLHEIDNGSMSVIDTLYAYNYRSDDSGGTIYGVDPFDISFSADGQYLLDLTSETEQYIYEGTFSSLSVEHTMSLSSPFSGGTVNHTDHLADPTWVRSTDNLEFILIDSEPPWDYEIISYSDWTDDGSTVGAYPMGDPADEVLYVEFVGDNGIMPLDRYS